MLIIVSNLTVYKLAIHCQDKKNESGIRIFLILWVKKDVNILGILIKTKLHICLNRLNYKTRTEFHLNLKIFNLKLF